jgi:hypothetical protein
MSVVAFETKGIESHPFPKQQPAESWCNESFSNQEKIVWDYEVLLIVLRFLSDLYISSLSSMSFIHFNLV